MLYIKSQEIETRLVALLHLVRAGRYCAEELATELGVSVPTVSRGIAALRHRGHSIRAAKQAGVWRYTLTAEKKTSRESDGA
jgi:biotin operon repressor